jgi:hypothetical protein
MPMSLLSAHSHDFLQLRLQGRDRVLLHRDDLLLLTLDHGGRVDHFGAPARAALKRCQRSDLIAGEQIRHCDVLLANKVDRRLQHCR